MNSPLSRIGSTTKLNATPSFSGSPVQPGQSPSITTPYVMNTVTTTTTGTTPAIMTQTRTESQQGGNRKYSSDLQIFKDIGELETLSHDITKSVGSFKSPEFAKVEKFVSKVDSIEQMVEQIKNSTALQREQALKTNQSNIELTKLFKEIMLDLKEYRKSLIALPSSSSQKNTKTTTSNDLNTDKLRKKEDDVTAEVLLEYALKLSKFSKMPRMVDMNITPANFVWPGEDSLRRGVLAMVSKDPANYVDFELNADSTQKLQDKNIQTDALDKMDVDNESDGEDFTEFKDIDLDVKKKENENAAEGLDLFDSEEEDDD